MALEEDTIDHFDDRHVDVVFDRELESTRRGRHALGDSFLERQRRLKRCTFPDLEAERAIATQRARAREDEITDAGETVLRCRVRSQRDAEARHLGQAARD